MAYTVNQLISGAYYAAGIVSRDFEVVSGSQLTDGLQWLNDIITEKRINKSMIPYESTYKFNFVAGQKVYFIPDLNHIDTIVFYIQSVRYPLLYTPRNDFFGSSRVENVNSLPFEWYWERLVGGGNLHIYFPPDQNYPVEIHGTFDLERVSLGQNLLANSAILNLGIPTVFTFPSIPLQEGQFVVNKVDLEGFYSNIGSLIHHINTGVIPGVIASLDATGNFLLTSDSNAPGAITVETTGFPPIGTRSKGVAACVAAINLSATYTDGNPQGVGATLTATAPGILILDGYTVLLNDRVLIASQTDPAENGIYTLTTVGTGVIPWVLTRASNYDISSDIQIGDLITITNGNTFSGQTWYQTSSSVSLVNFSDILFAQFEGLTFSNFSLIGLPYQTVSTQNGFDQFYVTYMRYALADRICSEYNYETPQNVLRQLGKYEALISAKSRILDLSMQKSSTLQKSRQSLNYGQINIGRGFTTAS